LISYYDGEGTFTASQGYDDLGQALVARLGDDQTLSLTLSGFDPKTKKYWPLGSYHQPSQRWFLTLAARWPKPWRAVYDAYCRWLDDEEDPEEDTGYSVSDFIKLARKNPVKMTPQQICDNRPMPIKPRSDDEQKIAQYQNTARAITELFMVCAYSEDGSPTDSFTFDSLAKALKYKVRVHWSELELLWIKSLSAPTRKALSSSLRIVMPRKSNWSTKLTALSSPISPLTSINMDPILNQVVGRCHVGQSNLAVIRYAISRLANQWRTFKALPRFKRRKFMRDVIKVHAANQALYQRVMGR